MCRQLTLIKDLDRCNWKYICEDATLIFVKGK